MSYLIISFTLNNLSLADTETSDTAFNNQVPVALVLGSTNSKYKISVSDPFATAQSQIFLNLKLATLTYIDAYKVRIDFQTPIHLLLYDGETGQQITEKIFRSFIIKTSAADIANTKEILSASHFMYDSYGREKIEDFISEAKTAGFDELIREYLSRLYPPDVRRFQGLQIVVAVDQIGLREGASVQHINVLSKSENQLSWSHHRSANQLLQRSLEKVNQMFSAKDPLIEEYLRLLQQMDARKQELERRGWLKGLETTTYLKNTLGSPMESYSTNNLISLPKRCRDVFSL